MFYWLGLKEKNNYFDRKQEINPLHALLPPDFFSENNFDNFVSNDLFSLYTYLFFNKNRTKALFPNFCLPVYMLVDY